MTDQRRADRWNVWRRFGERVRGRLRRLGWSRGANVESSPTHSNDPAAWRLRIALPGVSPENIDVSVVGTTVRVRAVQRDGNRYVSYYQEYATVRVSLDFDNMKARLRHGVLELTVPRLRPHRRQVEIAAQPRWAAA